MYQHHSRQTCNYPQKLRLVAFGCFFFSLGYALFFMEPVQLYASMAGGSIRLSTHARLLDSGVRANVYEVCGDHPSSPTFAVKLAKAAKSELGDASDARGSAVASLGEAEIAASLCVSASLYQTGACMHFAHAFGTIHVCNDGYGRGRDVVGLAMERLRGVRIGDGEESRALNLHTAIVRALAGNDARGWETVVRPALFAVAYAMHTAKVVLDAAVRHNDLHPKNVGLTPWTSSGRDDDDDVLPCAYVVLDVTHDDGGALMAVPYDFCVLAKARAVVLDMASFVVVEPHASKQHSEQCFQPIESVAGMNAHVATDVYDVFCFFTSVAELCREKDVAHVPMAREFLAFYGDVCRADASTHLASNGVVTYKCRLSLQAQTDDVYITQRRLTKSWLAVMLHQYFACFRSAAALTRVPHYQRPTIAAAAAARVRVFQSPVVDADVVECASRTAGAAIAYDPMFSKAVSRLLQLAEHTRVREMDWKELARFAMAAEPAPRTPDILRHTLSALTVVVGGEKRLLAHTIDELHRIMQGCAHYEDAAATPQPAAPHEVSTGPWSFHVVV